MFANFEYGFIQIPVISQDFIHNLAGMVEVPIHISKYQSIKFRPSPTYLQGKSDSKPDLSVGIPGLEPLEKPKEDEKLELKEEEKENLEPPKFDYIVENEFLSER